MNMRKTHRSFVSYIDKSREYYGAQGYEKAYGWAHFDEVPFTALGKPLSECRVGVVTTADKAPRGAPRADKLFVAPKQDANSLFTDKSWDREATHTDDSETYLPIERIEELVAAGKVGSSSERFYGVPTDYSQRLTSNEDAPQVANWMREDGVDIALLIPL